MQGDVDKAVWGREGGQIRLPGNDYYLKPYKPNMAN